MAGEIVTIDTYDYSADITTWPTADGGLLINIISVEVDEISKAEIVTADTGSYTADDNIWPTADGGLLGGAADSLDAIVIAAGAAILVEAANAADVLDAEIVAAKVPVGGGAYYRPPRPFPVEGIGYGLLPELEGEARGNVLVAGAGVGKLGELAGTASGTVGVAGRSIARLVVRAAGQGQRGVCGTVAGKLEQVAASASGAAGAHGSGSGTIVKLNGAAIGQHDDDEAAVMAFFLAA